MEIKRIGLDLAKYVFEVHAVDNDENAKPLRSSSPILSLALSGWRLVADRTIGRVF